MQEHRRKRVRATIVRCAVGAGVLVGMVPAHLQGPAAAEDPAPPPDTHGFQLVPEIDGLSSPTAVRFTEDGKVFVAEHAGVVKVYDGLDDDTPDELIDLRDEVHQRNDRGLTGLEVHPDWPAVPWVWLLFSANEHATRAEPWPFDELSPYGHDACGPEETCVATARLVRLVVDPTTNAVVGDPHDLIRGEWCQPHPFHSVGTVMYGSDGALYVGSGDGAHHGQVRGVSNPGEPDYGQFETSGNVCGDPMDRASGEVLDKTSEGGSLRAQDILTSGDPLGLSGAIIRVHPETGAALGTNPLAGGDAADDRHAAVGLRNPFRFAERPGAGQIYVADAGWARAEEINVVPMPARGPRFERRSPFAPAFRPATPSTVPNFGWPCYEGPALNPEWAALGGGAGTDLCNALRRSGTARSPIYEYGHDQPPAAGCGPASAISAIQFYEGARYPATYRSSVFVADVWGGCVWSMGLDARGRPVPESSSLVAFDPLMFAADIQPGPDGDLFVADVQGGRILRLAYGGASELGCPRNDAFEPNDDPASARGIVAGQAVDAVICRSDRDWYSFHALSGTFITAAAVPGGSGYRLALDVYLDGELLVTEVGDTIKGPSVELTAPETGIYSIQVRGASASSTDTYRLHLSAPCPDDVFDNASSATAAPSSPAVDGVRCAGETDWYGFDAIAGEQVVARFSGGQGDPDSGGTGPLSLTLYDAALTRLGQLAGTGATQTIAARESGRYHGAVTADRVEVLGRYRYDTTVKSAAQACALSREEGGGDAFEPNDTVAQATQAGSWPRMGYLCGGDRDVHVVPVVAGQRVTIRLGQHRGGSADFSDVVMTLTDGNDPSRQVTSTGDASGKQVTLVALQNGAFVLDVSGADATPRAYLLERETAAATAPAPQ